MTKRLLVILVLLFPMFAAADKVELKQQLVGKWNTAEDATIHVEFTADGKVSFSATADGKEIPASSGTYTWTDAKTVEITATALGKTRTTRYKIAVTGPALTMTTDKGKVTKYTRS